MKKLELEKYYFLLTKKGPQLEEAVYSAFKALGFNDITKKRSNDKEDWVFEFRTSKDYKYGIIEVKGSDSTTGMDGLRQLDEWVSDYRVNDDAKGIFVPNQFRSEPYPQSRNKRFKFQPNHLGFSSRRDICIIPSCFLFDKIKETLKTGNDCRDEIEKLIESVKGIIPQTNP